MEELYAFIGLAAGGAPCVERTPRLTRWAGSIDIEIVVLRRARSSGDIRVHAHGTVIDAYKVAYPRLFFTGKDPAWWIGKGRRE